MISESLNFWLDKGTRKREERKDSSDGGKKKEKNEH